MVGDYKKNHPLRQSIYIGGKRDYRKTKTNHKIYRSSINTHITTHLRCHHDDKI